MRQLLAGAVLIAAAAWFGRTTRERFPREEVLEARLTPDFVDRMSQGSYEAELCKRSVEFSESVSDLLHYNSTADWGHFSTGTGAICAWDIRQQVREAREKLENLSRLTRHRRFRPEHFKHCRKSWKEEAADLVEGEYSRHAGDNPVAVLMDEDTRQLLTAEKNLKHHCPDVWDPSQGYSWRLPLNDPHQQPPLRPEMKFL